MASVYSGMIEASTTLSDTNGSCPTEFCTWEPYTTLAVCSSFEDVSSDIVALGNKSAFGGALMSVTGMKAELPSNINMIPTFWMAASTAYMNMTATNHTGKLSDIYLLYYPVCDDLGNDGNNIDSDEWVAQKNNPKNWKAFKATMGFCLQTVNSTFNTSMETIVTSTKGNLEWVGNPTTSQRPRPTEYCHNGEGSGGTYCLTESSIQQFGELLKSVFTGLGSFYGPAQGDNYYRGQWTTQIASDIMGNNISRCDLSPNLGFAGFQRRLENVAVAMTNS